MQQICCILWQRRIEDIKGTFLPSFAQPAQAHPSLLYLGMPLTFHFYISATLFL